MHALGVPRSMGNFKTFKFGRFFNETFVLQAALNANINVHRLTFNVKGIYIDA